MSVVNLPSVPAIGWNGAAKPAAASKPAPHKAGAKEERLTPEPLAAGDHPTPEEVAAFISAVDTSTQFLVGMTGIATHITTDRVKTLSVLHAYGKAVASQIELLIAMVESQSENFSAEERRRLREVLEDRAADLYEMADTFSLAGQSELLNGLIEEECA